MHLFLSCLKKEGWFLIGFVEFLWQRSSPPRGKPHTAVTGQSYNKGQVSILGGTELSWGLPFIGLQRQHCPEILQTHRQRQFCNLWGSAASNSLHLPSPLPAGHSTARLHGTEFWGQVYRKPRRKDCTQKPGVPFNDKSPFTVEGSLQIQNTLGKYQGRNESSNSPPTWVWSPLWKDGSHYGLSGPQDVPCDCKTARTAPPAITQTTQWGCSNCSQPRFLQKQASLSTPTSQSHLLLFCSTFLAQGSWLGYPEGSGRIRAWVLVSDWLYYQKTTWNIQQVPPKSLRVCLKKAVLR